MRNARDDGASIGHDTRRPRLDQVPLVDAATGVFALGALLVGLAIGTSGPLFYVVAYPFWAAGPSMGGLALVGAILLGGVATLAVLVALAAGRRPYHGVGIVVGSALLILGIVLGTRLGPSLDVGGWKAAVTATPAPTPLTAPGWSITGSMVQARADHTATLLADGRVLVAGGGGAKGGRLASAELYDPASGTWAATGTMNAAGSPDRAILLGDGRVLVLDGWRGTGELYDPGTGRWRSAAPMSVARSFYTATLLADGRVLVAGGLGDDGEPLASTELFDPVRGTWRAARPMAVARSGHSATLLEDGRVLVAGGRGATVTQAAPGQGTFQVGPTLASAELFDPRTGRWHPTGSLPSARAGHLATRLGDGSVIVAGGWGGAQPPDGSVAVYRPARGAWRVDGTLRQAEVLGDAAGLLPDGTVLMAGGFGGRLLIYDPATGTARAVANAHVTTSGASATVLADGRVLMAGGTLMTSPNGWGIQSTVLAAAHLYDPRD